MKRLVMRPWLLRPPVPVLPSVSALTGLPFHSSERLISTVPRRLAVTGLNCLSAISRVPYARPVVKSIDWPAASLTNAFFTSERWPGRPLNRLVLPFCTSVFTASTVTPNRPSIAALISRLVASLDDAEYELAALRQHRRLLGDQRGADDLVHRLARQRRLAFDRPAHATPPLAFGPSRCFSPSTPAVVIASTSWFRMS